MNANPELGSTWKGRILMQIVAEKTEKPICMNRQISDQAILDKAKEHFNEKEYEIIAEVGQGIALPSADKFNVMIKIADFALKTEKPLITEGTYNRWSCRFKQQTFKSPC